LIALILGKLEYIYGEGDCGSVCKPKVISSLENVMLRLLLHQVAATCPGLVLR